METLESRLRDQLNGQIGGLIPDGPTVSAGIAGARKIHRRRTAIRRSIGGLGVALVAAATFAATSILPAQHRESAATPIVPIPTAVNYDRWADATSSKTPGITQSGFADAKHGFAMFGQCGSTTCQFDLRATSDGGRSWRRLTTPSGVATNLGTLRMSVFDTDHVVIEQLAYLAKGGGLPHANPGGWRTSDGGRTWLPITLAPVATAGAIPPGTKLTTVFSPGDGPNHLAAIDANGALTALTTGTGLSSFNYRDQEPLLAASATDSYLSVDLGSTWRPLHTPATPPQKTYVQGVSGGRVYAIIGPGTDRGDQSEHFISTADDGATWTDLTPPALTPNATPPGPNDGAPDSRMSAAFSPAYGWLFNDGARTWLVAPGTTTFTPADQPFPIVTVSALTHSNIWVATSADLRQEHPTVTHYVTSDGGAHWTKANW